jgi:hypothetical protein
VEETRTKSVIRESNMHLNRVFCEGIRCVARFLRPIVAAFCLSSVFIVFELSTPVKVLADAKSSYLIRLLQESSQFRVRAQAAISLGRVEKEPAVTKALIAALHDQHSAVRAASASSLERLGDPSALGELEKCRNDPETAPKQR